MCDTLRISNLILSESLCFLLVLSLAIASDSQSLQNSSWFYRNKTSWKHHLSAPSLVAIVNIWSECTFHSASLGCFFGKVLHLQQCDHKLIKWTFPKCFSKLLQKEKLEEDMETFNKFHETMRSSCLYISLRQIAKWGKSFLLCLIFSLDLY